MIVPPVPRWLAGEEPDEETFNERIRDVIEFLEEPPMGAIEAHAAQSIPNNAWTKVVFDTTLKDNDGMADLTNDRLNCVTPGWYEIVFGATLAAAPYTGRRITALRYNGSQSYGGYRARHDTMPQQVGSPSWRSGGLLHCMFLNENDTLEVMMHHVAGASYNTYVADALCYPFLQARWVSN